MLNCYLTVHSLTPLLPHIDLPMCYIRDLSSMAPLEGAVADPAMTMVAELLKA